MKGEFMRAVFAGAALAAFVITPTLADYYIVQEPRVGFGVRTEAESRMRTECRETTGTGGDTIIQERERPVERR
jgi:hypothetical protein